MKKKVLHIQQSIAITFVIAMLFSCTNDYKKVEDIFSRKSIPIGEATNVFLIHTDSGRVSSKLKAPLLYDFGQRKIQPYNEFPKGIQITTFKKNGDSITITGDYAITFNKTSISEIRGNVVVTNHKDNSVLKTNQLFWDQKTKYIFTEKKFTFTQNNNQYQGVGFDAKDDLSKSVVKTLSGTIALENE